MTWTGFHPEKSPATATRFRARSAEHELREHLLRSPRNVGGTRSQ